MFIVPIILTNEAISYITKPEYFNDVLFSFPDFHSTSSLHSMSMSFLSSSRLNLPPLASSNLTVMSENRSWSSLSRSV